MEPPVKEQDKVNQWYGVVYKAKRREVLHVAKVLRRFLVDPEGPVEKITMRCLKPKVGSGNILDETPKHLPYDDWDFDLTDIILGPLEVAPYNANQFKVTQYDSLAKHLNIVTKIERSIIKEFT